MPCDAQYIRNPLGHVLFLVTFLHIIFILSKKYLWLKTLNCRASTMPRNLNKLIGFIRDQRGPADPMGAAVF